MKKKNDTYQLAHNLLQTSMSPNAVFEYCIKLAALDNPEMTEAQVILSASTHFADAYKAAIDEWNEQAEAENVKRAANAKGIVDHFFLADFPMETRHD